MPKNVASKLSLGDFDIAQPGVAVLERFIDPKENPEMEIQGDEVTKYPKLKDFEPVSVKATRIKDMNGQITTSSWDIVDLG
jgi:hypothetical protein